MALALAGLSLPWMVACERLHGKAPWALALFLAVPWLAFVVAFRRTLAPGRVATAQLALGLVLVDVGLELANPGARLVLYAPWEIARVVGVVAGSAIAERSAVSGGRRAAFALRATALGLSAAFVAVMALLAIDGARDEADGVEAAHVDAVLLLGYALEPDGHATPSLVARADRAAELLRARATRWVIVSGGAAKAGRTEASAMHDLLRERGIAEERIVPERASRFTIENFACSLPLLRARGASRALLVTEPWHLARASLLARRHAPGITFLRAPAPSPAWRSPRHAFFLLVHEAGGYLEEVIAPYAPQPAICQGW